MESHCVVTRKEQMPQFQYHEEFSFRRDARSFPVPFQEYPIRTSVAYICNDATLNKSKVYEAHSALASFYKDNYAKDLKNGVPTASYLSKFESACVPDSNAIRMYPNGDIRPLDAQTHRCVFPIQRKRDPSASANNDCTDDSEGRTSSGDISSRNSGSDSALYHRSKRWNDEEQRIFIEAIRLHGRDWKKIKKCLPSRTLTQVRTHAYWYLSKLEREHTMQSDSKDSSAIDDGKIEEEMEEIREYSNKCHQSEVDHLDESIIDIARFISTLRNKPVEDDELGSPKPECSGVHELYSKKRKVVGPPQIKHLLKLSKMKESP